MRFESVAQAMTDVVECVRSMTTRARPVEIDGESGYIISKQEFEQLQDLIFADSEPNGIRRAICCTD
jgi:hypothetical protein